jgi:hypothetical protein
LLFAYFRELLHSSSTGIGQVLPVVGNFISIRPEPLPGFLKNAISEGDF